MSSQLASTLKIEVKVNPINIPNVGQESNPVIQIDFSFWGPKVSAHTGVKIVMKTSKNPERSLISNATSKFDTLAKMVKVIAVKTKHTVKIYLILYFFV